MVTDGTPKIPHFRVGYGNASYSLKFKNKDYWNILSHIHKVLNDKWEKYLEKKLNSTRCRADHLGNWWDKKMVTDGTKSWHKWDDFMKREIFKETDSKSNLSTTATIRSMMNDKSLWKYGLLGTKMTNPVYGI